MHSRFNSSTLKLLINKSDLPSVVTIGKESYMCMNHMETGGFIFDCKSAGKRTYEYFGILFGLPSNPM